MGKRKGTWPPLALRILYIFIGFGSGKCFRILGGKEGEKGEKRLRSVDAYEGRCRPHAG